MRNAGISVVASDAFTVDGTVPEAVRVCLGGPISREALKGVGLHGACAGEAARNGGIILLEFTCNSLPILTERKLQLGGNIASLAERSPASLWQVDSLHAFIITILNACNIHIDRMSRNVDSGAMPPWKLNIHR